MLSVYQWLIGFQCQGIQITSEILTPLTPSIKISRISEVKVFTPTLFHLYSLLGLTFYPFRNSQNKVYKTSLL